MTEPHLYLYQTDGIRFLTNRDGDPLRERAAYLADSMGLGKTVQAAVAAEIVNPDRALVIAPASALENWRREWKVWAPGVEMETMSWASGSALNLVQPGRYDLVILDEAHYAKNRKAKRTQRALEIARSAPRAWLLSGTPMPNHPGELYAPIATLWPEILQELGLRNHTEWFNRFCRYTMGQYGPRVYGVQNTADLKPYLKRIMLRRKLEDVALDLPPLRVDVSLLPRSSDFDRALEGAGIDPDALEALIEGEDREDGSASRLRRFLGLYKAPFVGAQIARELDDGEYEKIVVLYYHKDVGAALKEILGPHGVVGFDGSTPQTVRQANIDAFRSPRGPKVFLAQQTAAGVAINLQNASEIVLVEPAWTPDDNRQAIKRAHRIGSENPVRARLFGIAGTMDEGLMRSVASKAKMQDEVGL